VFLIMVCPALKVIELETGDADATRILGMSNDEAK